MRRCCFHSCEEYDRTVLELGQPVAGRTKNTQQLAEEFWFKQLRCVYSEADAQKVVCVSGADSADVFVVVVDKGTPEAPLGIRLDLTGSGAAYISGVMEDGAVDVHNRSEPLHKHVLQGQYIAAVLPLDARPTRRGRLRGLRRGGGYHSGSDCEGGRGSRAMRHLLRAGGRARGLDSDSGGEDEPVKKGSASKRGGRSLRQFMSGSAQSGDGCNSDTDEEGPVLGSREQGKHKSAGSDSEEDGVRGKQWVAGGFGCNARMLLRKIHASHLLQLEVRKPQLWAATIVKKTKYEHLGLEVKFAVEGGGLVVDRVVTGAVRRWNEDNVGAAVEKGDRILSVNGVVTTPAVLVDCLNSDEDKIVLVLSRPAKDPGFDTMPP